MTLQELEKRLSEATAPDWDIDRDIHYLGNDGHGPGWLACDKPRYTASLDAAKALCERLLPGHGFCLEQGISREMRSEVAYWHAEVYGFGRVFRGEFEERGNLALALCLAVVRAWIAKEGKR
jgi:hypothetical protein